RRHTRFSRDWSSDVCSSDLWWVAHNHLGDTRWWMFVLNSVAPYLFLPVPFVLLAGLRWRRWGLATAALVPAAVFLTIYGQALVRSEERRGGKAGGCAWTLRP